MARQPRLTVPGYPHHVIQRGNNRQATFLDAEDRRCWLALLREQATLHAVAVHAYVLMDNHLHLLLTPETQDALPRMMQAIGRRYVRVFNQRHDRTGTLWEGRYRSTLIEAERYLLACMAYIDLNPVRAGLVEWPADFCWSSHAHYVGLRADALLTPHALYWDMGNTPFAREQAYARLVQGAFGSRAQTELAQAVHNRRALGQTTFIANLEEVTQRRVAALRPGRPRRPEAA